jgi:hypothetical protein
MDSSSVLYRLRRSPLELAGFIVLSVLIDGAALRAQAPAIAPPGPPERAWASIGLGRGTGSTLAGVLSGWYSSGSFAIGGQYSEAQQLFSGDKHTIAALLLGARTSDERVFAVGGVGPAAARVATDCNGACPTHAVGHPLALGFSGQVVATTQILGLAVGAFGALGERSVSYNGVAVSVTIGWFGE